MKKYFLGLTLVFSFLGTQAQKIELTPQIGVTINKVSDYTTALGLKVGADVTYRFNKYLGFQSGLFYTQIKSPELNESSISGYRSETNTPEFHLCLLEKPGFDYSYTMINRFAPDFVVERGSLASQESRKDFLQIPIRLQYALQIYDILNIDFGAGGYLGYGITGKTDTYVTYWEIGKEPVSSKITKESFAYGIPRFDYGASFLLRINSNNLSVIAGADIPLYQRSKNTYEGKSKVYYLGFGYSF